MASGDKFTFDDSTWLATTYTGSFTIGQRPTYATNSIVIDPQAAAAYGQTMQLDLSRIDADGLGLQMRQAFARAALRLNPPEPAPLPPEPAPAPHDFSNPYLRMGKYGSLLCCKCGQIQESPDACNPGRLCGRTVQAVVEGWAANYYENDFALTTEWHPPRQRMPRPDAWQSSALMGGAWDLASAERRDGTRGRKRLPPR